MFQAQSLVTRARLVILLPSVRQSAAHVLQPLMPLWLEHPASRATQVASNRSAGKPCALPVCPEAIPPVVNRLVPPAPLAHFPPAVAPLMHVGPALRAPFNLPQVKQPASTALQDPSLQLGRASALPVPSALPLRTRAHQMLVQHAQPEDFRITLQQQHASHAVQAIHPLPSHPCAQRAKSVNILQLNFLSVFHAPQVLINFHLPVLRVSRAQQDRSVLPLERQTRRPALCVERESTACWPGPLLPLRARNACPAQLRQFLVQPRARRAHRASSANPQALTRARRVRPTHTTLRPELIAPQPAFPARRTHPRRCPRPRRYRSASLQLVPQVTIRMNPVPSRARCCAHPVATALWV